MKKRILIDGRFIGVGESISRYVLETLSGILDLDHDNDYTLLIRPAGEQAIERYPKVVNASNLKVDILDIPHYSLAEQTKLLSYLNKQKFDLVHFTQFNHPVFYKGNYVVTIHDLTLIGHLHYFNFIKQIAFNLVMRSAANDSKKIISISKTTEEDIVDYFHIQKKKIEVAYLGLDHKNFHQDIAAARISQFKEKYGLAGDYILYTGMWKKHKNLVRFFQAFEKFKTKTKSPLKLVLTGKIDQNEPEVTDEIKRANSSLSVILSDRRESNDLADKSIITTGYIEEEELPVAYAGALMYVIPSLSEGFGWPPLEAMACGTPVIASNLSAMPEILGNAPLYFDPYNIDEMAQAIDQVAGDERFRKELIEKGLKQAQKYDWTETARKTFSVYESLL